MTRMQVRLLALGAIFVGFALPLQAGAQSIKFNKDLGDTAHAMAGCWSTGATNFSDDGPGNYLWSLTIPGTVAEQVIAQADTANPATIEFREGGTTVVADNAAAGEGPLGPQRAFVSADGQPAVVVPVTNVATNAPPCTTRFGATTCTRETAYTATLTADVLGPAGANAVCGSVLTFTVDVAGDAYATCVVNDNGHADGVWRGQGTYPNIKPRLFYDGTQAVCTP